MDWLHAGLYFAALFTGLGLLAYALDRAARTDDWPSL